MTVPEKPKFMIQIIEKKLKTEIAISLFFERLLNIAKYIKNTPTKLIKG